MALAAGAFFAIRFERQIATRAADLRAFDLAAREASDGLSDLLTAAQAYVAVGQGVGFWLPKVTQSLNATTGTIASLRRSAVSLGARSALDEAAAAVMEFGSLDRRARDFLTSGQPFMASNVIFAEGHRTVTTASDEVEVARAAERQAFDAAYTALRGRQAVALAACGTVAALVVFVLGLTGAASSQCNDEPISLTGSQIGTSDGSVLEQAAPPLRAASPALGTAARLCTDFGRVRNLDDLTTLLARAADAMDATGLIVWLGSAAGADLQPVLAHGYSQQALSRMPPVVRSSNNAAAAAYRTGEVQIVVSRPGSSDGAIVAPILSADGCIGALSAEIRHGGEGSESVQALASIVAAGLAGTLTASVTETATARDKTA
ncbi:MAG: hypothetical protein A3G76_08320 [Acidobacteria bacterium RIFCSPLOWO2_12_FULL_65_11]|nr:MAG: hypothetical protein A3H95_14255 [Acidobacteria bacterium RIFCSPLOWO2_02_FULL_64_15]OFW28409.1 MAG: hypothetical protein A3G76_08320 [Acidobacteria bacterium RIFCSPLOWO2_12_FULL_65_11]